MPSRNKKYFKEEYKWMCCCCQIYVMEVEATPACPYDGHYRCSYCTVEVVNRRIAKDLSAHRNVSSNETSQKLERQNNEGDNSKLEEVWKSAQAKGDTSPLTNRVETSVPSSNEVEWQEVQGENRTFEDIWKSNQLKSRRMLLRYEQDNLSTYANKESENWENDLGKLGESSSLFRTTSSENPQSNETSFRDSNLRSDERAHEIFGMESMDVQHEIVKQRRKIPNNINEARSLLVQQRISEPGYRPPELQKRDILRTKAVKEARFNTDSWIFTRDEITKAFDVDFDELSLESGSEIPTKGIPQQFSSRTLQILLDRLMGGKLTATDAKSPVSVGSSSMVTEPALSAINLTSSKPSTLEHPEHSDDKKNESKISGKSSMVASQQAVQQAIANGMEQRGIFYKENMGTGTFERDAIYPFIKSNSQPVPSKSSPYFREDTKIAENTDNLLISPLNEFNDIQEPKREDSPNWKNWGNITAVDDKVLWEEAGSQTEKRNDQQFTYPTVNQEVRTPEEETGIQTSKHGEAVLLHSKNDRLQDEQRIIAEPKDESFTSRTDSNPDIRLILSRSSSSSSIVDSLFSDMTGSSMSSLSAQEGATERLVTLLLSNPEIKEICLSILKDFHSNTFEPDLRDLLKKFALDLRGEADSKPKKLAAKFVRFRARNSAHMICDILKGEMNTTQPKPASIYFKLLIPGFATTEQSESDPSDDELDDMHQYEIFIKNSQALQVFVKRLRETLQEYLLGAKTLLPDEDLKAGFLAGDTEENSKRQLDLKGKIQGPIVDVQDVCLETQEKATSIQFSYLGNFRTKLNDWTHSFTQLTDTPIPDGKTRIEWECKCGQKIRDDFQEIRPGGVDDYRKRLLDAQIVEEKMTLWSQMRLAPGVMSELKKENFDFPSHKKKGSLRLKSFVSIHFFTILQFIILGGFQFNQWYNRCNKLEWRSIVTLLRFVYVCGVHSVFMFAASKVDGRELMAESEELEDFATEVCKAWAEASSTSKTPPGSFVPKFELQKFLQERYTALKTDSMSLDIYSKRVRKEREGDIRHYTLIGFTMSIICVVVWLLNNLLELGVRLQKRTGREDLSVASVLECILLLVPMFGGLVSVFCGKGHRNWIVEKNARRFDELEAILEEISHKDESIKNHERRGVEPGVSLGGRRDQYITETGTTWLQNTPTSGKLTQTLSNRVDSLRSMASSFSGKSSQTDLPLHSTPRIQENTQSQAPHIPPQDLLFLLLCYPSGRYGTKLLQLDLITLNALCDKTLFHLLRTNYLSMQGKWLSRISLRKLAWIKFVNFEMYPGELVDVRKVNDVPPAEHVDYKYAPAPPDVIPPVGDNHLMHLFHNPSCATDNPLCLSRFPKKLKQKLLCNGGINPGWGLQFVESWDVGKIWLLAFVFFAWGSLLFGVLWAVFEHSIQDAFAIAGYMVAFATVTVGSLQALMVK